jgi:hypothetical protein
MYAKLRTVTSKILNHAVRVRMPSVVDERQYKARPFVQDAVSATRKAST